MKKPPNLQKRVKDAFDLSTSDPLWLSLLAEATEAEAMCRQLEDLVRSDGLVSSGVKGQLRIHPAVAELRQQRAAYARLLLQLGISDDQFTESKGGRKVAQQRWNK